MKKLLIMATLVSLVSCGKAEHPNELLDFLSYDKGKNEDLVDRVDALEDQVNRYYDRLDVLSGLIEDNKTDQDALSNTMGTTLQTIVELQEQTIAELIDPCGDKQNAYDEVLVKLGNGTIFGYFEQGNKRYLTVLPDGNYRTTDAQRCNFSINNGIYEE